MQSAPTLTDLGTDAVCITGMADEQIGLLLCQGPLLSMRNHHSDIQPMTCAQCCHTSLIKRRYCKSPEYYPDSIMFGSHRKVGMK